MHFLAVGERSEAKMLIKGNLPPSHGNVVFTYKAHAVGLRNIFLVQNINNT